jgi:hypothetical protein
MKTLIAALALAILIAAPAATGSPNGAPGDPSPKAEQSLGGGGYPEWSRQETLW